MLHTSPLPRARIAPSADRLFSSGESPLQFRAAMDFCRERAPSAVDCDVMRFVAEACKPTSRHAFRPAFTTADWRLLASFCVGRRLRPDARVLVPGTVDRTLRFLVEGSLWQESAGAAHGSGRWSKALLPGAFLGEDALFSDQPGTLDVRALEDSLVLELPLARQKELTAACPAIAFELLRAAGAVIAARGHEPVVR